MYCSFLLFFVPFITILNYRRRHNYCRRYPLHSALRAAIHAPLCCSIQLDREERKREKTFNIFPQKVFPKYLCPFFSRSLSASHQCEHFFPHLFMIILFCHLFYFSTHLTLWERIALGCAASTAHRPLSFPSDVPLGPGGQLLPPLYCLDPPNQYIFVPHPTQAFSLNFISTRGTPFPRHGIDIIKSF